MSDNIKVVVKVRPLIPREIEDKLYYQWRVKNNTLYQIDQNGKDCSQYFTFDKVYNKDAKTSEVYNDIAKPIVEAATAGFNGTIFAYGQTSSGKTYTMTGTDESPGIIPLAVINLFDIIKRIPDRDFLVRVSYVEIYNETLTDLFDSEKKVKIQETFHGVKVLTTEKVTTSPEEVLDVMKQGKANRQTASTNMNDESSRSHSIFQITIESRDHIEGEEEVGSVNVSQLNLVDLAGSERAGQTGATGIRFKEGTHINKSLSALALVIKQLSEGQNKHVNYRDSKLTRILQNSLGGNAKTSIICAVTPAAVEETISTLQFANRAKAIKNTPAVNAVATSASMIQNLTKQLSVLKTALENKKNVEQDNCNLQKQIAHLQRLILNGFHQRSSTDLISGARRKLCQPRRMTISTLHPIQEDPLPTSIPKFCTPSLKYNPLSLPSSSDFVPISGAGSLPCLPEEPPRLITPPPKDKRVNFNDEIIELDSDDDSSPPDIQTCSPYHKCYESSKTPPCILRKNYKEAEKNYRDIVKLTEREKIYSPDVIELMTKLEEKSLALLKLEENLNSLNNLCKEKDQQICNLQSKISSAEDELKKLTTVKMDLDALCKEYSTKLTDWEVSYENLMKKSKNREKELLSRLEEQSVTTLPNRNGTIHSPKKELSNKSEVDTTSKNNVDPNNDLATNTTNDTIIELRAQITLNEQTISELHANESGHKHQIETLEHLNKELKEILTTYKQNVVVVENENSIYTSKINDLNSLVESQKSEILSLNADIDSYNSVIQELQVKLIEKDHSKNITITVEDSDIDTMIANEELFIANNENMKNIIKSLKILLDKKNEELSKFKSSFKTDIVNSDNESELAILNEEFKKCKDQLDENVKIIHDLTQEKEHFASIEQELLAKLADLELYKSNIENINSANILQIETLKEQNSKLTAEILVLKQEYHSHEEIHQTEIANMSVNFAAMEENIKSKDALIATLTAEDNRMQNDLKSAKTTLSKLQDIIALLSGNIQDIPDIIDNYAGVFKIFGEKLSALESFVNYNIEDKKSLQSLINKHETEIIKLRETLDDVNVIIDNVAKDFIEYNNTHHNSIEERNMLNLNLQTKIKILVDSIKNMQNSLLHRLECNNIEIDKIKSDFRSKELLLNDKSIELEQKTLEVAEKNNNLFHIIFIKISELLSKFNIDNNISSETSTNSDCCEYILQMVDKLTNYIKIITTQNETKCIDCEVLSEAKQEIRVLTENNLKLSNDLLKVEVENSELFKEINTIKINEKNLISDLMNSNRILDELQDDLKSKTSEIDILGNRVLEWKEQFNNIDISMKQQLLDLEVANTNLKIELENSSSKQSLTVDTSHNYYQHDSFKLNSEENIELKSPPSLLTICCNRIIDAIQPNENDENISPTSSNTVFCNSDTQSTCRCSQLLSDVNVLQNDNDNFKVIIEKLKYDNKNLVKEQEDAREEIHLLFDSMYELQKKIVNHRTNLSTLTATTYAENKSLSSQLKFLQHYHSLFYKACEKDIPDFKKQLQELITILKTEYCYKSNDSLRRYSLPNALENSPMQTSLKFESLLDGDLLMLDTNITLTTCDNTLTGHDQTCFDVTQTSSEVGCQTNNCSEITEIHYPVLEKNTNTNLLHSVESLKKENYTLQNIIHEYELSKNRKLPLVDSQNSPVKVPNDSNENEILCEKCIQLQEVLKTRDHIINENNLLTRELSELTTLKNDLKTKYNSLVNEMPSTDALVVKLKNLEKDHSIKSNEISKLMTSLSRRNEELKFLQEENDSLSNQVMENIEEADNLKKELDSIKHYNFEITQKCAQLQSNIDLLKDKDKNNLQNRLEICSECTLKDEIIGSIQSGLVSESHKRLSRSYSDSDTSSRYNKICTLQNELHAGREDCKELKIEVTNIKNHLDRSNISISQAMDLDVSMGDSHTTSLNKECDTEENPLNKSNMPDIPEERPSDLYTLDKIECVNYCIEKTGTNKESFTCDMKNIDVMKMLYTNLVTKHNNEVENLVNKLRVYEESKHSLQTKLNNLTNSQEKICKEIEEKDMYLRTMASVVSKIKNNLVFINNITNESEVSDIVLYFKENFFNVVDKEFGLTSLEVFKYIVTLIDDNHNLEIRKLSEENITLQNQIKNISEELKSLSDQYKSLKSELLDKENAYTVEKERMYEISSAVTLEIAATQEILRETVDKVYQELLEQKIVDKDFVDMSLPISKIIPILFNFILQKDSLSNIDDEKNSLTLELTNMKVLLEEKNQLHAFKEECSKLIDLNKNNAEALNDVNKQLQNQITMHDTLKTVYDKKVEESETNLIIIGKLTEEVNILKDTIEQKETAIQTLDTQLQKRKRQSNTENALEQMTETLQKYKEIEQLKSANDIIVKENEALCVQLQEANNVIQQNKLDLEKITSDMLILKEAVDQSSHDMDNLRLESKTLLEENTLFKEQIKDKTRELSRLETNIKTHQKTAEIQCKIITRLKKEKADIDKCNSENINKAAELMRTLEELNVKSQEYLETINSLKDIKQSLEERISKLESEIQHKPRQSLEYNGDSRSRRQSLYESLTTFSENYEDPKKIENVFKSRKCDDLFMDVDGDSNRSTPVRLSKGRDSLASRHDQSEEEGSRASSVQATRRRRQSIHDAHRSVSALESSRRYSVDRNNESSGSDTSSELSKLRKQLSACQEELEEWREKFREVDEECETCAEYLREREEQCRNLKLEKQALETMIDELKQLQGNHLPKHGTVDAAVNTDEDWANLHSVVVDRMSYDAEVDKNKKLTRIIEELRYQKQELKNTMAKMQKALEKNSYKDRELEAMKSELANAQRSLAELKDRNRELDEECETCADYLKEREEQCRKLQDAKKALEIKLLDYQDSSMCMSVRKKRQTLHDRNRRPEADYVDVATETNEDFLSQTGESSRKVEQSQAEELQRLKFMVERVSQQKACLEQQLVAVTAATPLYVSTGSAIVQNQQFTDVMKENQKLKSINAKLIKIYKKNKSQSTNRENEDPTNEI